MTIYDLAVQQEKEKLSKEDFIEKLTQTESGYTEQNGKSEYKCQFCVRYIKETKNWGRCAIVEGPIRAVATCNYFQKGSAMDDSEAGNTIYENELKLSQEVAGYVEPDVTCGRCVYFNPEVGADPEVGGCRIVSGIIKAAGCCNIWKSK